MKIQLTLLTIFLVSLSSCESLSDLTKFDIDYQSVATIQSNLVQIDVPLSITTPPVQTNSEAKFSSNKTNANLIDKISLSKLTLTLTSPSSGDFGFLKSIEVSIFTDTTSEVIIASKSDIAADIGGTLELDVTDEDLKEFVKADSYSLKVKVVTDELITQDHEVDILTTFSVDAKIFGL